MADTDLFRLAPDECIITSPDGTQQAVVFFESVSGWVAKGWTRYARGVPVNPKAGLAAPIKHFRY